MDKIKKENVQNSFWRNTIQKFMKHRVAMFSLLLLTVEILAVILLPLLMDLDPYATNAGSFSMAPDERFLLGTDEVGRDVFSRLVYGGRVSIMVGFVSALLSAVVGIPLGLLAGYYGGVIRMVIMRLVDIFMSFPAMIIQLVLVTVLGASAASVMLVIGLLGWTGFARLTYSKVISVKEQEYVEAARASGATNLRQMFQYILPNSLAPLFVQFSFSVASAILQESGLSFLGLGVPVPTASWGNMIYSAQSLSTLVYRPWMWVPAGTILVATVLSINFIGDGLRDALDPKMKL